MFAYCNNNPVNMSDASGAIPFYDDPTTKAIEDFIRWYWETDENKTDDNGRPTIDASMKKTINTLLYCFDFSLGVGMGYYVGAVVFEIGIEAGMYGNLISIEYSDGQFKYGQDMTDAALILTIFQEELGFSKSAFKENGGIYEDRSWEWVNSDKDSWTIFGESIYVIAGFSFSIGFDIETFCHRMNEIVEAYR